mgnify:CR=1 FL=1
MFRKPTASDNLRNCNHCGGIIAKQLGFIDPRFSWSSFDILLYVVVEEEGFTNLDYHRYLRCRCSLPRMGHSLING